MQPALIVNTSGSKDNDAPLCVNNLVSIQGDSLGETQGDLCTLIPQPRGMGTLKMFLAQLIQNTTYFFILFYLKAFFILFPTGRQNGLLLKAL